MDLIVKLPQSQGYDSILTITDHDCSKAAIFIPCNKTIDAVGIAELYGRNVFPHYGPPKKVTSDRDPRFAANFSRELCKHLGIKQNISTAYHPQTDGQSERMNQWLDVTLPSLCLPFFPFSFALSLTRTRDSSLCLAGHSHAYIIHESGVP